MTIAARCTLCNSEFTQGQLDAVSETDWGKCPSCGTESLPCDPADDVTVNVNWHELRLLCMWAENHSLSLAKSSPEKCSQSPDVVYAICARLKAQHAERTALTLLDEFRGVRKAFPEFKVETSHPYDDGQP